MPELVVNALPLSGPWVPIGTGQSRGVYVEDFQCSTDAWGPLDASFIVKRSPRSRSADLEFWTAFEVYLANHLVWSGRSNATPGSEDGADQIQVNAEGWQAHTDDRPFTFSYIRRALSEWGDIRSAQDALLTRNTSGTQVSSDNTGVTITLPNGVARPAGQGNGVFIDLGPAHPTNVRIELSWIHSNNEAHSSLYLAADTTIAGLTSGSPASGLTAIVALTGGATGSTGVTLGNYRFISLALFDNFGSALTPGADVWIKLTSVAVYGNPSYVSGGSSTLLASDIVKDCLARLVAISSNTGYIAATSYPLPAFSIDQQTQRDAINAANSFQDWQASVIPVSPDGACVPTLRYRPRPTEPLYALTDQTAFANASLGAGDAVYNEVTYKGTGPDGTQVLVIRTTAAAGLPASLPDRRGVTKGYTIESSAPLTIAAATTLCDVFLAKHNRMPFKGSVSATSRGSVQILPSGANCPPWNLLRAPGEMMSFRHLQDPDTGDLGRDGRIAKATYTHATDSTLLDIDSTDGSFDALVSRLAIATAR